MISNLFVTCSSYGQSVVTSTFTSETLFCIVICIGGLVLFSHLIGNMQVLLALYISIYMCVCNMYGDVSFLFFLFPTYFNVLKMIKIDFKGRGNLKFLTSVVKYLDFCGGFMPIFFYCGINLIDA